MVGAWIGAHLPQRVRPTIARAKLYSNTFEANIEAGNKKTIANIVAPRDFECPLCGSQISKKKSLENCDP